MVCAQEGAGQNCSRLPEACWGGVGRWGRKGEGGQEVTMSNSSYFRSGQRGALNSLSELKIGQVCV